MLDAESLSSGDPTYDVSDSSGTLYGVLRWTDPLRTHTFPTVTGAGNLDIINDRLGHGHWGSPPSLTGNSGVAIQNTAWRDASIVVHTGVGVTVSAISVDGTSTGLTMAASSSLALPVVPSGKNVTLTFAGGTPTWDWWLA